uniref:O-methyltransferase ZRP4 n=1 Tax=Zea mays TaxID=4577 RepID=A0A804MJG2_MAIZE
MASEVVRPSDAELLKAQADIWRLSLSYLTPLSLRCAVELGIPTAIYRHGGAASAAELVTALSLPSTKLPFLRRLLRLLAASGVFTVDKQSSEEERYRISPVSYLLVDGIPHEDHMNHTALVLTCTSTRYIEAGIGLAEWFKRDVVTSPFEELHGATLFHESMGSLDADFHDMASEALDAHDNFGIEIAMREFRDLFEGIQSMTYCCGNFGDDKGARAIVKAFPHIKCTVLAPPKIIATKPADGAMINYVEGDMFSFIPPAQTVVLKCVKLLAQCRKAIPSRKDGGKVIIGDIMIDHSGPMLETHLLMDIGMMTMTKGRQRDEKEWSELFTKAGFSEYKILKEFGARVAFEVYP